MLLKNSDKPGGFQHLPLNASDLGKVGVLPDGNTHVLPDGNTHVLPAPAAPDCWCSTLSMCTGAAAIWHHTPAVRPKGSF